MGCCGGSAKTRKQRDVSPVYSNSVKYGSVTTEKKNVGDSCIYCRSTLAQKAKRSKDVWEMVVWCPVCRLEF